MFLYFKRKRMAMILGSNKLTSVFVCIALLGATASAQTLVQQPTRTITARNTASEDVYFIVRPSNDRRKDPTKIKVVAGSQKQIRYTGDIFDVWYSTVTNPTPIQIGASISFNNSSVLDIPVTPVTAMKQDATGKFVQVKYNNVRHNHVAASSILSSKWKTNFTTRQGNQVPAEVNFNYSSGTFKTSEAEGKLTGVKYLNLPNGKTEISGVWTIGEATGVFIFDADEKSFQGVSSQDRAWWGGWSGTRDTEK